MINELIIDAYGCSAPLSDIKRLEAEARKAIALVGANVANVSHHAFQPHGLTLSLILMESHLVISTWPEHNLAIINIFLCNDQMDVHRVWGSLKKFLNPKKEVLHVVHHDISDGSKLKKAG